jgi:hypothetical protein
VTVTRRYTVEEAGIDPATLPAGWQAGDGKLASAFVRATRPAEAATDAPATPVARMPLPVAAAGADCCGGAGGCCGA